MTTVDTDPFGHRMVDRELVDSKSICMICGGKRNHGGKPSGRLYRYEVKTEDKKTSLFKGLFCSAACWRTYWEG